MKKIIRVFPRRTNATPDDSDVRINVGPGLFDAADEIHISVSFTWDLKRADELLRLWEHTAPVKVGGPATGQPSGAFIPGRYIKKGYTITSRGCPNECWFCKVPGREGGIRELKIKPGNNVLDDNILACSESHIHAVFKMLQKQKGPKEFTGGLEAARLEKWHIRELERIRPKQVFFAYDTPDDLVWLYHAHEMLRNSMLSKSSLRCFVLCGYKGDSKKDAEKRMRTCLKLGFMPMAMLWRNDLGDTTPAWRKFQKFWSRPAIIKTIM